ncbi:hypothetical protein A9Q83_08440 [Alphaproteobacteria bacterium 46_93_T64]|nr:hypothetical protein A9Q83_08440 [Alphaproteobacteria bacterium 46_93_T64]
MKKISYLSAFLSLPILVSSCQTTSEVGDGDIYFFTDNFVSEYNSYISGVKNNPERHHAFAFDKKNGANAWVNRGVRDGIDFAAKEAVRLCQSPSNVENCKIFDLNGKVVWKGLNKDRKQELVEYANRVTADKSNRVVEYSSKSEKLGTRQIKAYKSYLKVQSKYDHSTFFVSANSYSYGRALYNGGTAYAVAQSKGLKDCKQRSEFSDCYLFAINGDPVNAAAKAALAK